MSKVVKGIKKVFKKIGRFVKKYWKVIAMAVAVYFTAGVALGAFASTASFSAAMPGFGAGGIFSKGAVAMGFKGAAGSGIAATASAQAAAAAGAAGAVGATGSGVSSGSIAGGAGASVGGGGALTEVAVTGAKVAGAATPSTAAMTAMGATVPQSTAAMMAGAGQAATGTIVGSTTQSALMKSLVWSQKLQAVNTAVKTIGGFLEPSDKEKMEDAQEVQFRQAYGVDREGNRQYGFSSAIPQEMGNMNKRDYAPAGSGQSSAFAQQQQPSAFLQAHNKPAPAMEAPDPMAGSPGQQPFIPGGG